MEKLSQITGLIYDDKVTKHKCRRKHPQRPQRVQAIMKALQQNQLLSHPKLQYINKIQRKATDQELALAHSKKYIKHIGNLWPKTSHRTDMTILDSYYNQFTDQVSRIAVGGLLNATDKLMQENTNWQNAFAVIRPPGHHSGSRNTINGFCVYNNTAITAKYLVQKYGLKKILIFDWDVHHGDGTQHIFKNDPNIVFISTHRYDHATFYPANQEGCYKNSGEGLSEGKHINIPLNFVDKKFVQFKCQAPGDNQYIYLFNRIIEPIIRNYQPQFIIVSAGFDAARYDPLGGFTITPNGYYYMTRRIRQLASQIGMKNSEKKKSVPLLVALEGGYNLKSTSQAAVGVVSALLNNPQFPQMENIQAQMHFKQVKNYCCVDQKYLSQLQEIIEHHSQNWKTLKNVDLIKYTSMIRKNKKKVFGKINQNQSSSSSNQIQDNDIDEDQNPDRPKQTLKKKSSAQQLRNQVEQHKKQTLKKQFMPKSLEKMKKQPSIKVTSIVQQDTPTNFVTNQFYFAAGHMQRFKGFSLQNSTLQKWSYDNQIKFYESDFPEKQFAPKYFGCDKAYITIENLLYDQKQPIIMDVKLSRISKNQQFDEQKRQKQKNKQIKSTSQKYSFRISGYTTPQFKQGGLLTNNQQMVKLLLKKVVVNSNKEQFVNFLTRMSQKMKNINRKFFGTSIVLIKGLQKSMISWVDFHHWYPTQQYDKDLVQGIDNLIMFINMLQLQQQ